MMKNYIALFLFLFFIGASIKAQIGASCLTPNVIATLPYSQSGLTTLGSGDDFDNTSGCGSDYMTGEDYVFAYMPTTNKIINVVLSGTGPGVGVFVLDACPDQVGVNCLGSNEQTGGNPSVSNISLSAFGTYYIVVSTYDYMGFNPSTVFSIDVTEAIADDAGVTAILTPVSTCGLGSAEQVTVEITNFGSAPISNFDVVLELGGIVQATENFASSIASGTTSNYTFMQTLDMSGAGNTYSISAYTSLPSDAVPGNDNSDASITNSTVIGTFPYNEDYESGNGMWTPGGLYSSWQLGTPAGTAINSASSGSNSWATNLTGIHNAEEVSWVISPCFDFSGLLQPVLEFQLWYETGTTGAITVEASTNGGASWTVVGANGDETNWYNFPGGYSTGWNGSSGSWVSVGHILTGMGGQSSVQLRIKYDFGGFGTGEGCAFDDITIYELPSDDLGVIGFSSPINACGLSASETVTIAVVNYGLSTQSGFDVMYSTDGGSTFVTETFSGSVAAGDTAYFTFAQGADLSVPGAYNLLGQTNLTGDADPLNDQISVQIVNSEIVSAFPHTNDFESNDGQWFAYGANSSWAYGAPSAMVINSASSGTKAWVTNLSGSANNGELSYLESRCFDLTAINNPRVQLDIFFQTFGVLDGAVLEYSLNNSGSWSVLNAGAVSHNWLDSLSGTWSGASGSWLTAFTTAPVLANQPEVKFRIAFDMGYVPDEGIGFDNFSIEDCYTSVPTAAFDYTVNGTQVTFSNLSSGAVYYYWDFGQIGGSSTEVSPVHDYLIDGNYTATLYAMNDCELDSVSILIDIITGIGDIESEVNIYPNPVHNTLHVSMSEKADRFEYNISDMQGRIVGKYSSESVSSTIDLSDISKGIYVLTIKNGEQAKHFRIIKD